MERRSFYLPSEVWLKSLYLGDPRFWRLHESHACATVIRGPRTTSAFQRSSHYTLQARWTVWGVSDTQIHSTMSWTSAIYRIWTNFSKCHTPYSARSTGTKGWRFRGLRRTYRPSIRHPTHAPQPLCPSSRCYRFQYLQNWTTLPSPSTANARVRIVQRWSITSARRLPKVCFEGVDYWLDTSPGPTSKFHVLVVIEVTILSQHSK